MEHSRRVKTEKDQTANGFKKFSLISSAAIVGLTLITLLIQQTGIKSHFPYLLKLHNEDPVTAGVYLLTSATLVFLGFYRNGRISNKILVAVAVVLKALAVYRLYTYFNHLGDNFSSTISLNSTFAFLLLGSSLFLLGFKRYYMSQSLAIMVASVQFLSLFGYIHEMPQFYIPFPNSFASLPETLGLVALSINVLFFAANRGYMAEIISPFSGGKIARRLFPMLLLGPFILESLRIYGEREGFYSSSFGIVLFFCAVLGITLFMILNSVRLANRIDWNLALEIEERRKTGLELKNSNVFLETIVENIPHMIFVKQGEELRFTSINKAGEKLLNIPREEYIGKTDDDFFPPGQADFFKQKDLEVFEKNTVVEFEEPVDTSNGTIWLRTKKFPIKDENGKPIYLVGISEDITEKRAREEQIKLFYSELEEKVKVRTDELSNSEKRFRALIENSTDGITITNEDFVIVYESPAVERMTRYSLIGREGSVLFDHIHPDDVAKCKVFYKDLNSNPGKPIFLQYRMRHSLGNYLWVEGTATNLLHEESVKATIFNYRDVTERKNHEHERELLIQELTRHNKDLRQFSYITSHNLRAPLSNLLGLLGLIKFVKIEDPTLKDIIEGFNLSTNSLNDTINDLLHILYVKENVAIVQEEVPVFHLLQKVITQVSNLLEEIDPDLVTNLDASDVIYFNKAYLESIFLNLLTNAIKYRSADRKLKLTILLKEKEDKTVLTFEDNGIGLDLNKCRSKVFGLYQRFHNHPDSKGLGLYLVKTQVEALGGTIDIESEVEKGTKFILTFNKAYAEQSFIH